MSDAHGSDPKDVELESLIHRRIREMGSDIRVSVKGGHVTLTGQAEDYEAKRDIDYVVKEIGGVREVTNQIRVAPTGG